jgi:uncharacterized LabA/DUF88 family protein
VGKNVAVFVDVANIFYAAKAAGVDIDYVTLLKSAIAGRDFVRAYAYTGLDPDNENQRNFHNFLSRHGYKVVSKDIRKYGDGKVKANLDIELVVDMLKTARNLDVAIVVSGDGDFAPAIRAVQEMGVRVEVISFRGNTSSDLMDVADQFTDIVQIAKVEKGSSRSGRRVADDGEDLSMTEVPDKLTEGTGRGRGRGTGRARRTGEPEREPAAAGRAPSRGRGRAAAVEPEPVVAGAPSVGLVALPGEKLSKAAQARLDAAAATAAGPETEEIAGEGSGLAEEHLEREAEGPRRRRRRGGRGRGRGRGHGEGAQLEGAPTGAGPIEAEVEEEGAELVASTPRPPRPGAFGSIWDSQIGQTRAPSAESTPFDLEEEEPAIPEYLIAEQRRGSAGRAGRPGGRGGRGGGYSAAVERERYGRGGGGINRYPDVSGRGGGGAGRGGRDTRRDERAAPAGRPERDRPAGGRADEPWSEVPPELEAMLRAQLARRTDERPAGPASSVETAAEAPARETAPAAPKARATSRRKATPATEPAAAPAGVGETEPAAPKVRATARRKATAAQPTVGEVPASTAPARRRTAARSKASTSAEGAEPAPETAAPKRRTATRKKAETPEA